MSTILMRCLMSSLLLLAFESPNWGEDTPLQHATAAGNAAWHELSQSMDVMHEAMAATVSSGNADVDFVDMMLPHHEAAIDMAKAQLLYGKDPQMRRLAQEIIADQQLEMDLMQLWLKSRKQNQ
jgi:uncharacterized protein (DUF305 family)